MTGGGAARVAVIGATGNVGTSVVAALAADPAVGSVLGVARRLPEWRPDRTEWARADIRSDELVPLLRGADVVIHLAWLFQPTHRPEVTWRTNVLGSQRVLEAVAGAGVPALVYASSVGAYSPGPASGQPVDESWPTDGWPTASYPREKAYLERLLDIFEHEHPGIRVVRMRPGFMFKREAASQQRRLFAGPLLPGRLARPGLVPVVPRLPGLRFQVLHTVDAADAFRRAALSDARGAFNLAAEPVADAGMLARCLGARVVDLPERPVASALSAIWRLRLVPASPYLLSTVLRLPVMDTGRARQELGWAPSRSSQQAIEAFLEGLASAAGMATPPLQATLPGGRLRELASRAGARP